MVQTHTDMHGEWFMLFDECERTIQDAGYRGSITLPMDDFFRCKQKAMVSATPIIPSDPRFEQQGFTMKILRPTYDHKPKMLLIHTNNTVGWVRTLMGQVKGKGHPLCIFLNSTDTIHRMICTYKIEKRCKVFCSYESVKKLRKRDFSRAYSSLEELDEINFFTSRFFSAVDIELPTTACVLIVTDLSFAAHTVIDPTTEAVQIVGRFRNGVEDAAHIFSTNKEMPCKSREEIAARLEECEAVYKQVLQIEASGAGCDTRAQALEGMDYKRFMNADGTRNWFMWDNAYDDERIKWYYTDAELVREEYAKAFHTDCAEHIYPLSDCDRLQRINPRLKMKDLFREIVRQLEILEQNRTWNEYYFLREEIQKPSADDGGCLLRPRSGRDRTAQLQHERNRQTDTGKRKPTTADLGKSLRGGVRPVENGRQVTRVRRQSFYERSDYAVRHPLPQKSDGKDDRNIFRVQGGAHQQTTVHRIGKADHIARNG